MDYMTEDQIDALFGDLVGDISLSELNDGFDEVSNPSHYCDTTIQPADFIADHELNFFLGNVVKYICRDGKKHPEDELIDLKKAQWYLNYEIKRRELDGRNIESDKVD